MLKPHLSPMPHRPGPPKVSGRADVIVLGAGVVGVTTAYALARRGLKVAIVDRAEGPGRGTSFANGAQLSYAYTDALGSPAMLKKLPMLALGRDPSFRVQATVDPAFLEWGLRFLRNCTNARFSRNTKAGLALALESRLAMHALTERHKFDFGHEVAGKMHLFYDRSAFAAAREVMALKRRHGAVQNALSPQEALAIEPALAGAVGLEGVIHSPEDEVGDPFRFASGLLDILARDYGVEAHFGFDADRLRIERGSVAITDAAGATITGERLAVCLGVAAPRFLRKAGMRVPVWPMKGYSFTAAPGAMAPRVSITDTARKIVFCSLAGRMRVAGLAELGAWDPSRHDQPLQALVGLARQSLPGAAAYDALESEWAGLRPMSPSSVPIISRPRPELLLNIGHGMLGWTFAMGAAERAASLIDRQD